MSQLLVPKHIANDRVVPDWFLIALRDIDPSLIVFFNPIRARWVLDRCTLGGEHGISDHTHSNECPRTNVKIIQSETGEYLPLSNEVLDWLRAHDTWNQHSSVEQFLTILNNQGTEYQEKLRKERREYTHHRTTDNRRQLAKAFHLIQQHDLKINR